MNRQKWSILWGPLVLLFSASIANAQVLTKELISKEDSIRQARSARLVRTIPNTYGEGPYTTRPVFPSPKDSADYAALEAAMKDPTVTSNSAKFDSIRWRFMSMPYEKASHYRKVYRGTNGFTRLETLEEQELTKVKKVSIYKAKRIPKKLYRCKSVEEIELVDCQLKRLPGKLRKLNLIEVRVYDNRAEGNLKLSKNKSIERLLVRGPNPMNIPTRFDRLNNLRSLDLSMTGMEQIPTSIFKLDSLKMIKLGGNKISLTNYQFPKNSTLRVLELGANNISIVPSSIGNLTSLVSLTLSGNKIEVIEPGIGNLQKLTQLTFYKNKIKALPKDIYKLSNLREIDLYYNELEKLDEEIAGWQKLEVLYLSFNKLISLPESISSLKNLRGLYVHDNRLSNFTSGLDKLSNLKVLRINNNYLMAVPNSISNLSAIENIDLSNNSLRDVPDGLWNLKSLQLLSLGANPWADTAWESILKRAEELRQKQVVVNLKTLEEEMGNQK